MTHESLLYINGEYKPLSQANISVLDQGFLLGDGVFDVVSAWKGSIFKLDEHLDRFFQSLQAARLTTAMTREGWREAIIETVRRNELRDANIRFIVTRGVAKQVAADPRDYDPTSIIWAAPYVFLADEEKRNSGIRLFISHLRSFTPDTLDPRYKCLDRLHIVTRGVAKQVAADPRDYDPTSIIWAAPYVFLADEEKRNSGIRLFISHLRSFTPDTLDPRYKCLDRLHFQLAKIEALEAGYDDVIWLSTGGYVSEGPASNIFMVRQGTLYTPGREVLHGITRQTFLDLAQEAGIPAVERDVTAFDLYSADEVFTCSTAGGALAVREVAGRPLQGAVPGPLTQQLDSLYWQLRESGAHGTPVYA